MANYQETQVTGTKWQRCNQVLINNPYNTTPAVAFKEETVVVLDSGVFIQSQSGLACDFDPQGVINLRDPATGALTGQTMSQQDVYVALYSMYLQLAEQRDQAAP